MSKRHSLSVRQKTRGGSSPNLNKLFEKERKQFMALKGRLLADRTYESKFVAIINGTVADSDLDRSKLMERIYSTRGYVPVYVGKVSERKRFRES
jgi:hypothetical protein